MTYDLIYDKMVKPCCRVYPYKPKPLCHNWIGDYMVDMYDKFDFDLKMVDSWGAYVGHWHKIDFSDWDSFMKPFEEDDKEIEEEVCLLDKFFRERRMYLH